MHGCQCGRVIRSPSLGLGPWRRWVCVWDCSSGSEDPEGGWALWGPGRRWLKLDAPTLPPRVRVSHSILVTVLNVVIHSRRRDSKTQSGKGKKSLHDATGDSRPEADGQGKLTSAEIRLLSERSGLWVCFPHPKPGGVTSVPGKDHPAPHPPTAQTLQPHMLAPPSSKRGVWVGPQGALDTLSRMLTYIRGWQIKQSEGPLESVPLLQAGE